MSDDQETTSRQLSQANGKQRLVNNGSNNEDLLIIINQDGGEETPLEADDSYLRPGHSNNDLSTDDDSNERPRQALLNSSGDQQSPLPDVTCVFPMHPPSTSNNNVLHSYGSNQDAENQPLLKNIDDSHQLINNTFPDDAEFNVLIRDVEQAIEFGHLPDRISQGSSGSYFVKNSEGNVSFVCLCFEHFVNLHFVLENPWCIQTEG